MSNLIEHKKEGKSNSSLWEIVQDHFLDIVKFVAVGLAIYVIARLIAIPFGYGFLVGHLSSDFGLEETYARPFAVALTALVVAATPTILLAIFFGYRAQFVFVATLTACVTFAVAAYFFTSDVYFDRVTGTSQKCYAKTLEGFKFSSTCDFDPKLGVRFQEITSEVVKEIIFWQKNGTLKDIPPVNDGQYFDPLTGESIVWYSLHSNGSIRLFSLPGFDPATGKRLKPITEKVIGKYRLDDQEWKSVIADIKLALADGYGEYGSTESSRQALRNIWKWYYAQKKIPEVASRSHNLFINGEFIETKVEKVIEVGPYTLLTIKFTRQYYGTPVTINETIEVHDKDANTMSFKTRPEVTMINDKVVNDLHRDQMERTVFLNMTTAPARVMIFIDDAEPGQMNAGYVVIDDDRRVAYNFEN